MAMSNALAEAVLKGDGVTRSELEQLCRFWLKQDGDAIREFEVWQRVRKLPDFGVAQSGFAVAMSAESTQAQGTFPQETA